MVYWIWIEVTDDSDWLIFKFKQYKCVNIANFCVLRKNSIEIKRRMIGYHCTPLMILLVGHLVLKPFGPEMKHHPYSKEIVFSGLLKIVKHKFLVIICNWLVTVGTDGSYCATYSTPGFWDSQLCCTHFYPGIQN